jgi:hypothetical protein
LKEATGALLGFIDTHDKTHINLHAMMVILLLAIAGILKVYRFGLNLFSDGCTGDGWLCQPGYDILKISAFVTKVTE